MSLLKIVLSLYLFISVILTQFSTAYFFSRAGTNYRWVFSALTLCIGVYLFGYLMIINSSNLQEMIFWNQVQYLGLPFISALWLLLVFLYSKNIYKLEKWMLVLLLLIPVITFFMRLTNSWHHLFYRSWDIKQVFGYPYLNMERGHWYYINISYSILCLLLAITIYYVGCSKKRSNYISPQFWVFLLTSFFPLAGIIMIASTYGVQGIDYAALFIPISFLVISYGIFKYDFLEIKTLARETIFENSSIGMVILESELGIIDYNKAAKNFFAALNIPLSSYPAGYILDQLPELSDAFNNTTLQELSLLVDGEKRFYEIDSMPLGKSPSTNMRMLKSIRDITENKRVQEKLRFLATTDFLSGLYNRAEFMELAQREFIQAQKNNRELSFLMIDLDRFKIINDTFGHAAGDEVIREIGNIIRSGFRKTDIAGRLGGEEFAVVLNNTSLEEAKKIAKQFLDMVNRVRVVYGKQEIRLTASIGVAAASDKTGDESNIENVIRDADDALYKAKSEGRNCVVVLG